MHPPANYQSLSQNFPASKRGEKRHVMQYYFVLVTTSPLSPPKCPVQSDHAAATATSHRQIGQVEEKLVRSRFQVEAKRADGYAPCVGQIEVVGFRCSGGNSRQDVSLHDRVRIGVHQFQYRISNIKPPQNAQRPILIVMRGRFRTDVQ